MTCFSFAPECVAISNSLFSAKGCFKPIVDYFRDVKLEDTYFNRDVEKAMMAASKTCFLAKTEPTLLLATNVGNMYTPSLYGGLVSYLSW